MLPSVWPGDELTIQRRHINETRIGEIAVFTRADRLFAHRVVAGERGRLVTQGDGVPTPDALVNEGELLGIVVSVFRHGKPVRLPHALSVPRRIVAALVRRSPHASRILQRGFALLGHWRAGRSRLELGRSTSAA
jgi:hypothetical protein